MRFSYGYTRFVILAGNIAIKIPIGNVRAFCVMVCAVLRAFYNGSVKEKLGKYPEGARTEMRRRLSNSGIEANRREIATFRRHPNYPIAPILRSYLGGFIIVMRRGEPTDFPTEWTRQERADLFDAHHICRINGKPCFVDYGHPAAEEILTLCFGH